MPFIGVGVGFCDLYYKNKSLLSLPLILEINTSVMANTKSFTELINGDQPVLVDFYATWCGPCKMMQPILQETAEKAGQRVKIVKVDVDKNPAAAQKFQVRGVPTLILFQKGKTLWRKSGVVPAHELISVINREISAVSS